MPAQAAATGSGATRGPRGVPCRRGL